MCGGTTQNSHAMLTSRLGPAGPGALLFDDGFAVAGTTGAEGSTCRWDLSFGGPASLLPPGGEAPAAGLVCGTDVIHPQISR